MKPLHLRWLVLWLLGVMLGQNSVAQQLLGVKALPGFLISHHPEMQNMEAHVLGIELSRHWIIKHEQKPFNGMKAGIGLMYMDLGRPNINGKVIAFIPNVEVMLTQKARHPLWLRIGTGAGYITKPYSFPDNQQNKAIGTHINGCMQLILTRSYKLFGSDWGLLTGLGLTHFSNGNFKKPNLGINMPHLSIGLHRMLKKDVLKPRNIARPSEYLRGVQVTLAYARREVSIDDPKRIHIYGLSLDYTRKRKEGHYTRLGTDFFVDYSYPYQKFTPDQSEQYALGEVLEHGFRAGYLWKPGKIGISGDVGAYTYRPRKLKRRYYFMVG